MDQQITAVIINRKEHKLKVFSKLTFKIRDKNNHLPPICLWNNLNLPCSSQSPERLWLPPGPVCGGGDAGCVLSDGPAMVRRSHRALHLPCQQPEAGVRVFGPRRAAQVPGHPRAALHGPHDLHPDGLLCLHDLCAKGQWMNSKKIIYQKSLISSLIDIRLQTSSCNMATDPDYLSVCLQFIPMPVLYGVFLYMGASSLRGIQVSPDSACWCLIRRTNWEKDAR